MEITNLKKRRLQIIPYTLFILTYMGFLLYFLTLNPGGSGGNPLIVWVFIAFASGGMLMMAIYSVMLYLFRQGEKATLYFALICVSVGVRFFVLEGSETIVALFSGFPINTLYSIRYASLTFYTFGMSCFVIEVFTPLEKHLKIYHFIRWAAIISLMINTIVTAIQGDDIIYLRMVIFFTLSSHTFYVLYLIAKSKDYKTNRLFRFYFFAMSVYIIEAVLAGLFSGRFPNMPVFTQTFFVIAHVILLSQRYSRTIDDNELLDKLNRTKSELFAAINHNMKTPLTIIATDIQLAEKFTEENQFDKANELLKEAWQETMMLADQVTGAITLSRENDSYREMSYIDFEEVIEGVLKMYEPIIKKQGNTLLRHIEKDLKIWGNAQMLSSVLTNILDNANRHTKNGNINVSWQQITEGELYCLEISDNGSGIAPELLPRVFERGVSGADSSGLGLGIVKSIMELHNGKVDLQSKIGKGTKVKLFFKGKKAP